MKERDAGRGSSLRLDAEQFRSLGYRVINAVAEHLAEAASMRPVPSRAEMDRLLAEPIPRRPASADAVVDRLIEHVLPATLPLDHPGFLAFVPGPSNPAGALADMLATGYNVYGGTWLEAAGPIEAELVVLG